MKFQSFKKILIALLVCLSLVAIGLNAFVLNNAIKLKSQNNDIKHGPQGLQGKTGPQGSRGKQGPIGERGLPGIPGIKKNQDETTFETLPITYRHHSDDRGVNHVFGNLKKWYDPNQPPAFGYSYGKSTFFPSWYNQDAKSFKKFYVGDRIFFEFDIHLERIVNRYFGICFRFTNLGLGLRNEFTKIFTIRDDNNNLKGETLKHSGIVNDLSRAQMAWKPATTNHIIVKGTIDFSVHGIFFQTSSLMDDGTKIKKIYSMAKLKYDSTVQNQGYLLRNIGFGSLTGDGSIENIASQQYFFLGKNTKLKFWEAPYNKNLGLLENTKYTQRINT